MHAIYRGLPKLQSLILRLKRMKKMFFDLTKQMPFVQIEEHNSHKKRNLWIDKKNSKKLVKKNFFFVYTSGFFFDRNQILLLHRFVFVKNIK